MITPLTLPSIEALRKAARGPVQRIMASMWYSSEAWAAGNGGGRVLQMDRMIRRANKQLQDREIFVALEKCPVRKKMCRVLRERPLFAVRGAPMPAVERLQHAVKVNEAPNLTSALTAVLALVVKACPHCGWSDSMLSGAHPPAPPAGSRGAPGECFT